MNAPFSSSAARIAVLAGLAITAACHARPGGGGSACIFSLDPASPSDMGTGALYRDDPNNDGVLTVLFTRSAIGVPAGANLDAISGGMDSGALAVRNAVGVLANPLDNANVIYQYSVGRGAVDGVTGNVAIPFAAAALITQRADYATQFTDNPPHAWADIFDNRAVVGRWNFPMVDRKSVV